jgi:outer membrane protein TolC
MSRARRSTAAPRRVAFSLSLLLGGSALAQDAPPRLSLEDAIARALAQSPDVAVGLAQVTVYGAAVEGARVFPNNPLLRVGAGGRLDLGQGAGADGSVRLQQALPLFGRWGRGVDAAEAGATWAELDLFAQRCRAAEAAAQAYVAAQRWGARLAVADKRITLLEDVVATTERQLAAGNGTLLDVTLWQAELGQAEARRAGIDARYAAARIRLALLTGLDTAHPPVPTEPLSLAAPPTLAAPRDERPDVAAQAQAVEVASRELAHESAKAWPDVSLTANAATEGAAVRQGAPAGELVAGAGVVASLPLFERNQGGIASARAAGDRERAELARAQKVAAAEVAAAQAALAAAQRAAELLKTRVVDKQARGLELLRKAYDAGKLGVTDVLLRQRSALDAESAYASALADLAAARVRLAAANGALAGRVRALLADEGGTR